jgi:hypothetical protein
MRRPAVLVVAVALVVVASASWAAPGAQVVLRSQQRTSFTHNQGVARVAGGWILSGTDKPLLGTDNLVRTDDALNILAVNVPAIPPQWRSRGYDHIGDIDVVGNTIYAPLEQPTYSKGTQVTARYDARTLLFLGAVVVPQHENSFVAVDPVTMTAYSMDHFDGANLMRYDVRAGWKLLPPLHMSETLHHTQGADTARGAIWISTSDPANHLYRVNLRTGKVDHIGTHAHPGGEGEGIDAAALPSGDLHALILDADQRHVWFEHFVVVPGLARSDRSS